MSIVAELTADHQHIVLVAGGDPASNTAKAKQLQTLTPAFGRTNPPGGLMTGVSWATLVQLSAMFGDELVQGPALRAWVAAEAARRTSPAATAYVPPTPLTAYSWQSSGAAMIAATGRALITDEPGTGKTITTILGLAERYQPDDVIVVVCPASVIDPWVEAWKAWAPHLDVVAWRGPRRRKTAGGASVYVTSYDTARIDAPTADSKKPRPLYDLLDTDPGAARHLVIDECHLIKNQGTHRSKAVVRLAKLAAGRDAAGAPLGSVVALSGTPITHHPGDIYPTLEALDPVAFPSRERWVRRYCIVLEGDERDEILGLTREREPEFRLSMLGQQRRVAKADVLTELPPKVYSVRTVELPAKWRKAYDEIEADMLAELPTGETLSVMSMLALFTRLSQLASAPAKVTVTHGPELDEKTGLLQVHTHVDLLEGSWKVDALLEVMAERPGEPVVAAAPSRQLMMLAGQAAEKAGLRVGYIVGGQTPTVRTQNKDAFQAGELDLICVTTSAGGVGITLTAAKTLVFLQRPWPLVEAIQMEDRCHRIGSEHHDSIEIIDLVAANTIESRVRAVLRERAGQLADFVQDSRIATSLLGGKSTDAPSNADQLALA